MPLFCQSIHCFRPTFGKRSCKKHRCSTPGCMEPRHVQCANCFTHTANQMEKTVFQNFSSFNIEPTNQIIFGGKAITITNFNDVSFDF